MIVIFIALIILYLGVILFVGTTFVKISLFAMDKLAVFIVSWYYTHHYFSVKFSSGYAVYFWDILAAIVAVVLYSVLFKLIHDKFGLIGKILNLAIILYFSTWIYYKWKILFSTTFKQWFSQSGGKLYHNRYNLFSCMEKKRRLSYRNGQGIRKQYY